MLLTGYVYTYTGTEQEGVPGIPVVGFAKAANSIYASAHGTTDKDGGYTLELDPPEPKATSFLVDLRFPKFAQAKDDLPSLEFQGDPQITFSVDSTKPSKPSVLPAVYYGPTFFPALQKNVEKQIDTVSGFGIVTEQLDYPSGTRPGGLGPAGGVALRQVVDHEIKAVLGRLPKPDDPRSFVAALNQRFTTAEVEGRTVYEWTPRSYIGQSDLGGGVTGAQASLVTFASNLRDESVKLIDGLYSLIPDADPQQVEAERTMLRSEWTAFVEELGIEGGLRVNRAEGLVSSINDHLTELGKLLGTFQVDHDTGRVIKDPITKEPIISRELVVTIEEEQNLTNFIAVNDYISSVQASYNKYKGEFLAPPKKGDLGRGLVLLSRELSVVAESVDESQAAMDSVFVGPAERLTITIPFESSNKPGYESRTPMTVDELMTWITTFATTEASTLIQEGGTLGARTVKKTAEQLDELVEEFKELASANPGELPKGLRHPRVTNTLEELSAHLKKVVILGELLEPSEPSAAPPPSGTTAGTLAASTSSRALQSPS